MLDDLAEEQLLAVSTLYSSDVKLPDPCLTSDWS